MNTEPEGIGRTRIVLRPYASPLPLGFLSFAVGMALLGGMGLGWLASAPEVRSAGVLMVAFVFPLELVAAVTALVVRTGASRAWDTRADLEERSRDRTDCHEQVDRVPEAGGRLTACPGESRCPVYRGLDHEFDVRVGE